MMIGSVSAQPTKVTTHHYDEMRSSWNQSENVLTPSAVGGTASGELKSVTLDELVDAQPLRVTGPLMARRRLLYSRL
jgi:hypothetical protein